MRSSKHSPWLCLLKYISRKRKVFGRFYMHCRLYVCNMWQKPNALKQYLTAVRCPYYNHEWVQCNWTLHDVSLDIEFFLFSANVTHLLHLFICEVVHVANKELFANAPQLFPESRLQRHVAVLFLRRCTIRTPGE